MSEFTSSTLMAQETAEAPAAVAAMLDRNRAIIAEIVRSVASRRPSHILTSARGSSDHAASYFKYLSELRLGTPCCSLGASVVSIYRARLVLKNTVLVSISQSGQSPDILSLQDDAKRSGVLTIALTNREDSPLAQSADLCLPLHASPERSPAATKSFIASAAACAWLIAALAGDAEMLSALDRLPAVLDTARSQDWSAAHEVLAHATSLYVLGRGPSLAIAQEAALKLKETCGLHAEGFSAAEIMHGPLELVGTSFPVVAFCPADAALPTTRDTVGRIRDAGATVIAVAPGALGDISLSYAGSGHALLDPISIVQSFYGLAERLSRLRGRHPDRPRLLRKETATL